MRKYFFPRIACFMFLAQIAFFVCSNPSGYADCSANANDCIVAGNEAVQKHDIDKAIKFYEKAAAQDPKSPAAVVGLGHLYLQKGDDKKAIQAFDKAIALNAKEPNIYIGLGSLYLQKGDKDAALKQQKILSGLDKKAAEELLTRIKAS